MTRAGRGSNVGSKCKLTVGPHRRHEVIAPAAPTEYAGEEAGHHIQTCVFERDRWHGNSDILCEQSHETVYITGLVGTNEPLRESLLGG